nr:reverse transcriptase domain-containing protein [Desulfonema magnum]
MKPRMKGRCFIIRWADDFILGSEAESDAYRVMDVLPKRFERFGLSLNMKKTKLIMFGRPDKAGKYKPGTFDFLGFAFCWAKTLRGYRVIKKKTAGKRLSRFLKSPWGWCRRNRHKPLKEQYGALCEKLRGYYRYYGVRSNCKAPAVVHEHAVKA